MWRLDEIVFDLASEACDTPVVTLLIGTPAGEMRVMGELVAAGDRVHLIGAHADGPGANRMGAAGLRVIARAFAERFDVKELVVEGAARTTGARPGHKPLALRWRHSTR